LREEQDRDPVALGVPGSLSNRPVAGAAKTNAEDLTSSAQRNAATRQYAYDRTITQIQRSRSRLRKLHVAVVLNSLAPPAGAAAWTETHLANVERVLRSGLGIDETRGDTLVVSTLAFPTAAVVTQPWWQQREYIVDIASWLFYLVLAVLAFVFLVRPLMKLAQQRLMPAPAIGAVEARVVEAATEAPALQNAAPAAALQSKEVRQSIPVSPLLEDYDLPPPGSPVDVMIDHLKVLAAKEPERVAEVVKQWVQKNVRAG
jgi:flagellar M-ring protein FliF